MNKHTPLPQSGKLFIRHPAGDSFRLTAVGDLSLHGRVSDAIRERGADVVFAGVRADLDKADLRIGNLETVLTTDQTVPKSRKAQHIAGPEAINALQLAGFDVLTFANNHILDKGHSGILDTIDLVRQSGGTIVGAGASAEEARKPVVVKKNGLPVSFFAYSYGMGQIAGATTPGCNEDNLDDMLYDLSESSVKSTVRIVSLHTDAEFQPTPSPGRVAVCRRLIDAGAHLVLCHHPHVPQGIERWGDGIIAYSLGNYVSPISPYMRGHSDRCDQSFHLHIVLDSKGACAAEAVAVRIDGRGCPYLPEDSEQSGIRALLAFLSEVLGDPDHLERQYREMVGRWVRESARAVYWSLRKLDVGSAGLVLKDLARTPCKQRWFKDWLTGMVGG